MAKKKNALTQMLDHPDKELTKTFGYNGVLSRMFRTMLKDMDIGGYKFSLLMNQFLSDPKNNIPNNKKDQTSNRGNLNKEFQKGQMTWKVFCKALSFLQIIRFKITLEVTRVSGETTCHEQIVNLNMVEDDIVEDDDDLQLAEDMPEVAYLDHHYSD